MAKAKSNTVTSSEKKDGILGVITLPPGTARVLVHEIPKLIATALHPKLDFIDDCDESDDFVEMDSDEEFLEFEPDEDILIADSLKITALRKFPLSNMKGISLSNKRPLSSVWTTTSNPSYFSSESIFRYCRSVVSQR